MSNIFKTYSQGGLDVPALSDINLSIEEGEYVALEDAVAEQRAQVTIGLGDTVRMDRELAVAFARQFGTLDEEAKNQIRSILESRREGNR